MENFYRLLMKLIIISIAFVIAILLMTITELRLPFAILFLVYAGSIWKYKINKIVVDDSNSIIDFYDFFQINKNTETQEIMESYDYEMRKLNDDLNISLEHKSLLSEQIEEGFNTLTNPDLRLKYNIEYDKYIEDQNQFEIEKKNTKFNFFKELANMISLNKSAKNDLKSYIIIFSIIGLMIFIATMMFLE